jgi:TolA-binding protein
MREQAAASRLPELVKQVRELQQEIEQLSRLVTLSEHE